MCQKKKKIKGCWSNLGLFGGEITPVTKVFSEFDMGDSHCSCLILRSIFALLTNPGDQYSSLESVGLYEKGANEQVVMDCFVWGGGGGVKITAGHKSWQAQNDSGWYLAAGDTEDCGK